jgi:hypothetical protein
VADTIFPEVKFLATLTHTVNSGLEMVEAKHVSGKNGIYVLVYFHRQKQAKKNF